MYTAVASVTQSFWLKIWRVDYWELVAPRAFCDVKRSFNCLTIFFFNEPD